MEEMMKHAMKYGPQTVEIEALLARALALSDAEVLALGNARGDVLWDAAYRAARNAAFDAAFGAIGDAVWGAALAEARYVAWTPALALVARDLIAPDGFTQAHYDLLTGPWRRVIGAVHTADAGPSAT